MDCEAPPYVTRTAGFRLPESEPVKRTAPAGLDAASDEYMHLAHSKALSLQAEGLTGPEVLIRMNLEGWKVEPVKIEPKVEAAEGASLSISVSDADKGTAGDTAGVSKAKPVSLSDIIQTMKDKK